MTGAARKKQYHSFFHGAPKNSRKKNFYTYNWLNSSKSKYKKLEH